MMTNVFCLKNVSLSKAIKLLNARVFLHPDGDIHSQWNIGNVTNWYCTTNFEKNIGQVGIQFSIKEESNSNKISSLLSFRTVYPKNKYKIENSNERTKNVMKILTKIFPNDRAIEKSLKKLCEKYADICALEMDCMTVNNFYTQSLTITDNEPVYTRNYRTPHSQKEEINDRWNN